MDEGVAVERERQLFPWEINALKTAHRRVPLLPVPKGHCRWCELPINGRRGKYIGRPDPNRSWCRPTDDGARDCYFEFLLHSRAQVQFSYLEVSRGLRCAECGIEAPTRERWEYGGLSEVSALEVDHVVPLWKVALMPIELRRPFFGPEFLQLLCFDCHKIKTGEEAAERALVRAAARKP
jgi:hypothetical protein